MQTVPVTIGPYTGYRFAEGGFATVYRVPESPFGRPVALKWASAPLNPTAAASLEHEFRMLGEMVHPQLPRVYDFGWAENRPYLVMDWIEGDALWSAASMESPDGFLAVLRQMAGVLLFIHRRGWVHGDLKPDNFLWRRLPARPETDSGTSPSTLYLLDFGLSRPVGDTGRPRGAGTVGYTAPEFLQKKPADGRADWYSVGVILYEWVFGRRPFAAAEPALEIAAHIERPPDFGGPLIHPVPEGAIELLERLLSKVPEQRAENEDELFSYMSDLDPSLQPDALLNSQIDFHRRSQDRRIDSVESDVVRQVVTGINSQRARYWTIAADRYSAIRLSRAIAVEAAIEGCKVPVTVSGGDQDDNTDTARTTVIPGMPEATVDTNDSIPAATTGSIEFVPLYRSWRIEPGDNCTATTALTLLQWDARRVEDYLRGMTGDPEFAAEWSPAFHAATGGLPQAVSELAAYLINSAGLRCVEGHWETGEEAIDQWRHQPEAISVFADAVGNLTPDERRVCDWFSLGRGRANTDLLERLWSSSGQRFTQAFDGLRIRGLILPTPSGAGTGFFNWRFRLRGLAESWRAHLPPSYRQQRALELAGAIECCGAAEEVPVAEVLAACFADAASWDKSAHYSVVAAAAYLKASQPEVAVRYITRAQNAADRIADDRTRMHWLGRARMLLGDYQKACGQIDDARRTYRELLVLGRRSGDRSVLAEALKNLGGIYRTTRRFEKGVRLLRRARQLWEEIGHRGEVARILTNLGNMYWVASDRDKARRYYGEALDIAQTLGDEHLVAMLLSNLGATYWGDHDFARAESFYRQSLELWERIENPVETAGTLNNLGVLACDRGQLGEADRDLRRAIEINLGVGARAEALFGRGNLILVMLERGDLRAVVGEAATAIDEADTLGDVATGAEIRGLLAEAYLRAGDFRLATACLDEGKAMAGSQKNDNLDAQLGLIAAARYMRLGLDQEAVNILNDIEPVLQRAEMPRIRVSATSIRMQAAVAQGDVATADALWDEGRANAERLSLTHWLAQLAFARLPEDPAGGYPAGALSTVEAFLQNNDNWHWAGAFKLWKARYLAIGGQTDKAEDTAQKAITHLRRDGNWETLWRALVIYGKLCFARADYEPALRAFEEAHGILTEIERTIASEDECHSYHSQPLANELRNARERILQLTA